MSQAESASKYEDTIKATPKVDTSSPKGKEEFRAGMKDESEHTDDPKLKEKLVKDHMKKYEDSPVGYYAALDKLEDTLNGLKKTAEKNSLSVSEESSSASSYDSSKPEESGTVNKEKKAVKVGDKPEKAIEKTEVKPMVDRPQDLVSVLDMSGPKLYRTGTNVVKESKPRMVFAEQL